MPNYQVQSKVDFFLIPPFFFYQNQCLEGAHEKSTSIYEAWVVQHLFQVSTSSVTAGHQKEETSRLCICLCETKALHYSMQHMRCLVEILGLNSRYLTY